MAAPKWKFLLANSGDYSNVGELSGARSRQLQLTLNKSGSLSFTAPLNDPVASQIYPITHCIKAMRLGSDNVWRTIWSGPVWTIDEDISGERITVNAVGWLQMLEKRLIRSDLTYTNQTDADIILALLALANMNPIVIGTPDTGILPGYSFSVMPGGPSPSLITAGTKTGTFQNRTIAYQRGANILQEIQRLTEIESGCDIWIDPTTWQRSLNLYDRLMTDRTDVLFAYNWGPSNIQQFGRQFDPSSLVNFIYVAGAPVIPPAYADTKTFPDPTQNPPKLGENSQKTYGLWEEMSALSDVTKSNVLTSYAAGEILIRSSPRIIYTFTPFPFVTEAKGKIPEPFIDYKVGDKVYLSARYANRIWIDKQAVRIFGIQLSIDDNGNETLGAIQTSPS
jgi:hypothetical protein